MSDLTNQINELFGDPQQPQQEPVVEEIVEEVQPQRKPHVYKKLEKPRIAKRETPARVIREQKQQTNFNINESIDELETGASNIATTAKDTLGGAAGSLAKNPMIDKFVQVASERFAKRPLTDKVSFIVRLMEIFGVDDGVLVRVRNDLKKAQQQAKAPQQPQQGAQE